MKRLMCAALAGTIALVLSTASLSADTIHMFATLTPGEETPNALLSGAVGTVNISVDTIANTLAVDLNVYNLPAGTTAGHIHVGPKGVGGPVVIDFPIPTGVTGDMALSFTIGQTQFHSRPEIGIVTIADAIQSIVNGNAYANIHTSANPGGEIRGQLVARR